VKNLTLFRYGLRKSREHEGRKQEEFNHQGHQEHEGRREEDKEEFNRERSLPRVSGVFRARDRAEILLRTSSLII
jgi:hypothetical protein